MKQNEIFTAKQKFILISWGNRVKRTSAIRQHCSFGKPGYKKFTKGWLAGVEVILTLTWYKSTTLYECVWSVLDPEILTSDWPGFSSSKS